MGKKKLHFGKKRPRYPYSVGPRRDAHWISPKNPISLGGWGFLKFRKGDFKWQGWPKVKKGGEK